MSGGRMSPPHWGRTGNMTPTSAEKKLAQYQRKRDFTRTSEPAGASPKTSQDDVRHFVVQRHRARRLHYDLRFEIDGVLVSWAVPKGPTLDPNVKRAAVHVEDHPIEYADFEGVIPAGEYGGGDVIVWDRGTWAPHATTNPAKAVADGELHVDVHGEKLRGRFVLIRRRGRRRRQGAVDPAPQARRRRGGGMGSRGASQVCAQRPHQRRGEGRSRPAVAVRFACGAGVNRPACRRG